MWSKKGLNHNYILIIPRFEDIFHSFYSGEIIKGIGLAASRLKVDVIIHIASRDSHKDWLSPYMLNRDYAQGILFADIDSDKAIVYLVKEKKIPYMVLNNHFSEPINCISIDNKKATTEVIEYLISLGHKRIATIAGDLSTQAGKSRLEGFREVLAKHKISLNDNYITPGGFLRTPAREAAMELLALPERPTAIFAASDVMALELIDVAKKMSLRIPQDLSVVGFDDNPINNYSPVKLTTVSQPIVEMGRLGLENLHQIAQGKLSEPVKILLPARLIKRDSCMALTK